MAQTFHSHQVILHHLSYTRFSSNSYFELKRVYADREKAKPSVAVLTKVRITILNLGSFFYLQFHLFWR